MNQKNSNHTSYDGDTFITVDGIGYKKNKILGQGAFGQVWSAKTDDGREAVLKFHKSDLSSLAEIEKEMQVFSVVHGATNPQNIYKDGDLIVTLLPKVPGMESNLQIESSLNAPVSHVMYSLVALFNQLQGLHNAGYVHGDIKLENLMLTTFGGDAGDNYSVPFFSLIDFGLVSSLVKGKKSMYTEQRGTPTTMAPELNQVQSGLSYTASDIFSSTQLVASILGQDGDWAVEMTQDGFQLPGDYLNKEIRKKVKAIKGSVGKLNMPDFNAICQVMLDKEPYVRPRATELVVLFNALQNYYTIAETIGRYNLAIEANKPVEEAIACSQLKDAESIYSMLESSPLNILQSHVVRANLHRNDQIDGADSQAVLDRFNRLYQKRNSVYGKEPYQKALTHLAKDLAKIAIDEIQQEFLSAQEKSEHKASGLLASVSKKMMKDQYIKSLHDQMDHKWKGIERMQSDLQRGVERDGLERVVYDFENEIELKGVEKLRSQPRLLKRLLQDRGVTCKSDSDLNTYIQDLQNSRPKKYSQQCSEDVQDEMHDLQRIIDEMKSENDKLASPLVLCKKLTRYRPDFLEVFEEIEHELLDQLFNPGGWDPKVTYSANIADQLDQQSEKIFEKFFAPDKAKSIKVSINLTKKLISAFELIEKIAPKVKKSRRWPRFLSHRKKKEEPIEVKQLAELKKEIVQDYVQELECQVLRESSMVALFFDELRGDKVLMPGGWHADYHRQTTDYITSHKLNERNILRGGEQVVCLPEKDELQEFCGKLQNRIEELNVIKSKCQSSHEKIVHHNDAMRNK